MTTTVSLIPPYAVQWRKAGRLITLGKVYRQANDDLALGTPYRDRRFVTPSLPRPVLDWLLAQGVRDWVVRFDKLGTAYRLPLVEVAWLATLSPDGELAVKFQHFQRCEYPDWPYAERTVLVEP